MRKAFLILITLLCLTLCGAALAETVTMDSIYATCEIPSGYIVLRPDNLGLHQEWLDNHDADEDSLLMDWAQRGVVCQAWSPAGDLCIEISVVKDADAETYFDMDQVETAARTAYRSGFAKNNNAMKALGYTFQSAEWKNAKQTGRFLVLKYKRSANGDSYAGFARRSVRNGYTIMVDVQVHGRALKNTDQNLLNSVMDSWSFSRQLSKPVDVVSGVVFTSEPPRETNTGKFTVSGTTDPGLRLIGVLMRMTSPDPIRVEATASARGKFSLDVALPKEGVWLMTVTLMNGDEEVGDYVFNTTTFQKTLLPINFIDPLPTAELVGDKLVISGTTMRLTEVQCIVSGAVNYEKHLKTNNTGKFTFTIDSSAEGDYNIVLVFAKKHYSSRRFTVTATRTVTHEDMVARAKANAIKPAYKTLNAKLSGYTGKIMKYLLYTKEVTRAGDEWVIFMAMKQAKDGSFKDIVVVTTDVEPNISVGSVHTMYGTCTGSYTIQSEEGDTVYPCFRLIQFDD